MSTPVQLLYAKKEKRKTYVYMYTVIMHMCTSIVNGIITLATVCVHFIIIASN
jgi:hypothetical protein